ncbi:UDP-glucose 4-epimerase GalE [Candidatus Aerophobetes bacterium]|nr:UDP-glucose 4-epimerase GalE [Candidatus Aerophobetes bacterium]
MRVLVTGGAGYIGSITTEELLKQGQKVVVFDSLQQGHKDAVLPEAVFVQGDLSDKISLENVFQSYSIDAVVHLAAETVVEHSMTDPKKYFHNNVINGINLLDSMLKYNVEKIIFSSSAAVYGEPVETPIQETHPQNPVNSYGESKLMFEKILDWYHRAYGVKYISLRYFNAAGASEKLGEEHHPETHLIPLVLKCALNYKTEKEANKKVKIFGTEYPTNDGTCVRDYIHVVDLAKAHILALEQIDELGARVYNLGNGDGYSVHEVIDTAKKITGADIEVVFASPRRGDPAVLIASSSRIKEELGWKPEHKDLESIIQSAWSWYLNHPERYSR